MSGSVPLDRIGALEGMLDEAAALARDGGEVAAFEERVGRVYSELDDLLSAEAAIADDACAPVLERMVERVEEEARALFRDSAIEDDAAARAMAAVRVRTDVARRLVRAYAGRPRRDEVPFLLAELRDIENGLCRESRAQSDDTTFGADGPGDEPDDVDDVRRLRLDLVCTRAERQLDRARAITGLDHDSALEAWAIYRDLEAVRQRLSTIEAIDGQGDRVAALRRDSGDAKRDLAALLVAWLEGVASAVDCRVAIRMASLLAGELDEARVSAYEGDPARVAPRLSVLHDDGLTILVPYDKLVDRITQSPPEDADATRPQGRRLSEREDLVSRARRTRRRLRRMVSVVRNLRGDRILASRLDRVFGPRLVRRWEAFIFWLIMATLALIVIQDPEHAEHEVPWTVWVDTGICLILLVDFFTRLTLSPHRLRYFRRHFLTEFLPSLPFGLLARLDYLMNAGWIRVLRVGRVFRILRIMRPFIRVFRMLLFIQRAADRIVDRNAWLLNRNIVFFEGGALDIEDEPLLKRVRGLESWVKRTISRQYSELSRDSRRTAAAWRSAAIATQVDAAAARLVPPPVHGEDPASAAQIDADEAIRRLHELDENQIQDTMGVEFAERITASLRVLRLPMLRNSRLSVYLFGKNGDADPLLVTARLGRFLGDVLGWVQRVMTWFADLYGTITGAQFLDRVGMQLVKATGRPTKRILMFGLGAGLLVLVFKLTSFTFLDAVADFMLGLLTTPVIVLGIVCVVPLVLGIWFRRIAGQAADFYDRIAEAQFLSLTEITKEKYAVDHLEHLVDRVIAPEARLSGEISEAQHRELASMVLEAAEGDVEHAGDELRQRDDVSFDWARCDFMLLFYRNFLDGAFFHRNDTKVAHLLLGNLTLENVRRNRLAYGRRELKRLDRLDVARGKGGIRSATVWFNCITDTVAQQTARLILEYNQHCIAIEDLEATDSDRARLQSWLAGRRAAGTTRRTTGQVPRFYIEEEDVLELENPTLNYRTTQFNALHFLTASERRDGSIARRFGPEVAELMVEDRAMLIRELFGTFPMHDLPKDRRTFNPFEAYKTYVARGRSLFLPFVAAWFALKGLRLLARRVGAIARDLLSPGGRSETTQSGHAGFEVARRKIHRMRRPVAMEALRLRAEFDVEYLGLSLPGREPTVPEHGLVAADLQALNASEREWEQLREVKSAREEELRVFSKIMAADLADVDGEALRVMVTAFACDTGGARGVAVAYENLLDIVAVVRRGRGRKKRGTRGKKKLDTIWPRVWSIIGGPSAEDAALAAEVEAHVLASRPEVREHAWTLAEHLPEGREPHEWVRELMLHESRRPTSWNEQMVAVRTIQVLAMLDLEGYEREVRILGKFEEEDQAELATGNYSL